MSWTVSFADNILQLRNPETVLQMCKVQGKCKILCRHMHVVFYKSDTLNKNVVKLDFLQACFLGVL